MKTWALLAVLAAMMPPSGRVLAGDVDTPPQTRSHEVAVYKSPWCGCCVGWVQHLRASGFEVKIHDVEDLSPIKRTAGIPSDLQSCHTAFVGGYAVEGHVPADVISRVLAERPDIEGVAVPGMPVGSPGMEGPDPESYDVMTFTKDGSSEIYTRVEPK